MNIIEKATIQSFHNNRAESFGETDVKSLGWKNLHSQQERFRILSQIGDLSHATIADLGCGSGDLKPYLDQHFHDFHYIGIDQMPRFIKLAQSKFASSQNVSFLQADFCKVSLPDTDYILASGAFGYQCDDQQYFKKAIAKMILEAKKGITFNMLDDQYFKPHKLLKAHNRKEVTAFCKSLAENVEVITGYLEDDFTIIIRK